VTPVDEKVLDAGAAVKVEAVSEYSYPVMGFPFDTGAGVDDKVMITEFDPGVYDANLGAPGVVNGITPVVVPISAVPAAFVAITWKVYSTPAVRDKDMS